MKKILNLAILLCFSAGCSAQNPILNITEEAGLRMEAGAYYKDINNILNPFEGTWLYSNGTTSLKIILIKKINHYNGKYYSDLLIGEYQYIENGVEKINTLSDINTVYLSQSTGHRIGGNGVIETPYFPPCNDCGPNEKRVLLMFKEPNTGLYGNIVLRKITIGGQQALKVKIRNTGPGTYLIGTTPPPDDFVVHSGEYILIKQ